MRGKRLAGHKYRSAGARACEESELLAGQVAHALEKHMRGGRSQTGLRLAVLVSHDGHRVGRPVGRAAFASSSSSVVSAAAAAASTASTAAAAATGATGASVPADRRPGRQHACRYALCYARQGL